MPEASRLWSTGGGMSQSSVVNRMQIELSEIAVVQISRTEYYIMKCYSGMVDQIPLKRRLDPEINGNPIVYIGDLTFEIRTRAARHGIKTRGRSRLNKS